MATWTGVITNAGNALLNEWVNEKTLDFGSAAAGQGTVAAAALMAQTALVSQKQVASLLGGERLASGIRLKVRITAPSVAYTLNQFGVWASVDDGETAMIALFQLEQGIPIPNNTESPDFVYTFYALISCSNTGTWTVTVDSSTCVTQADMTEAISTKQNKITANGLLKGDGLGNITAATAGTDYGLPTITATVDPTTSTVGAVGQSYLNTLTMQTYYCTEATGGIYTWKKTKGGVAPRLTVTVTSGSTVSCTNGVTTLSGTSVDGSCAFDLPDYGTWAVTATLNGATSDTVSTVVDQVKQYEVELSFFSATLRVTAAAGAVVTAVSGSRTYTGTCASNGECSLTLKYSGTYTISATKGNATSSQATKTVSTSGSTYTATVSFIVLTVTVTSGSAVTVTNGGTSETLTSTGTAKFYLPNTGVWNVTATLAGETASGSVSCIAYSDYALALSYVKVFGVVWNYANTSTALTRLTASSDPNSLVNVDITTEPSPAVGGGQGSSPFDSYAPWCDMDEYNITGSTVGPRKGESGFSRSTADVMVWIPEFYFRVVNDSGNSKRYFYIADKAKTGFTKHPGSGRYVGRYHSISGYYSKTGAKPLANITRATARTNSKSKGTGWHQYDFASYCAIQLLYLIEFADWDSQGKIGKGYVDGSATVNVGGTDSMSYHTGRASGTDGKTQVQYRHIEDLCGNIFDWVDGANFSERAAYICTNPANYADDTATNYTATGVTLPSSGWTKGLGVSNAFPWAYLPNAAGGSETTYIPDYVYSYAGWRVLYVGGDCGYGSGAGLFCFIAGCASSNASASIGSRLLFAP